MTLREEMTQIIDSLPQRGVMKQKDIDRYLNLMEHDPRAIWHTHRLNGFGGSEVGVFVSHKRNEADAFGATANGVILEKRLTYLPKKQTLAMRKGIIIEEGIRQIFLEDYKATRDTASIESISNPQKRFREWARYSPDDVVMMGNKRYLIDYKHPHKASLHQTIITRYLAQLHLGALIAESEKIKLDGMLLVQYPESGGDSLVVSEIPFDAHMADDIVSACDDAWDMLKKGMVYPEIVAPLPIPAEVIERAKGLGDSFVKQKLIADRLYKRSADAKEELIGLLVSGRNMTISGTIDIGDGLSISVAEPAINATLLLQEIGDDAPTLPRYSEVAMTEFLVKSGVDMTAFETGERVLDLNSAQSLIADRGLKLENFMTNSTRFLLKSSAEYKTTCQALADEAFSKAPDVVGKSAKPTATRQKLKTS